LGSDTTGHRKLTDGRANPPGEPPLGGDTALYRHDPIVVNTKTRELYNSNSDYVGFNVQQSTSGCQP